MHTAGKDTLSSVIVHRTSSHTGMGVVGINSPQHQRSNTMEVQEAISDSIVAWPLSWDSSVKWTISMLK